MTLKNKLLALTLVASTIACGSNQKSKKDGPTPTVTAAPTETTELAKEEVKASEETSKAEEAAPKTEVEATIVVAGKEKVKPAAEEDKEKVDEKAQECNGVEPAHQAQQAPVDAAQTSATCQLDSELPALQAQN